MADISEWSPVDESNNQPPPAGWPEGMAPSAVNNSARALMGGVRRWYDTITAQVVDIYGRLNTFLLLSGGTITGNLTVTGTLDGATITTTGPNAAYSFDDRTGSSGDWVWYATGGIARLWNAADLVTIDTSGTLTADLDINAGRNAGITGILFAGSADISGNLAAAGTVSGDAIYSDGEITAAGSINAGGGISAGGTVSGNAIYSSGQITAVGTITGGTITGGAIVGNTVHANTTLSAGTSVSAPTITASGTVSGAYVSTSGNFYADGALDASYVQSRGDASVAGKLTVQAIDMSGALRTSSWITPFADHGMNVGLPGLNADSMHSYAFVVASDARLKSDIETPAGCLELLQAIPPRTYRLAGAPDPDTVHWGLVAGEVKEALQGRAFGGYRKDSESGEEGLAVNEMLALLWGAARELAARLETLEKEAVHAR